MKRSAGGRPRCLATTPAEAAAPIQVHPYPDLLIAFPSWLRHAVAPHSSADPRLRIAFNGTAERPCPPRTPYPPPATGPTPTPCAPHRSGSARSSPSSTTHC
ncbi:putative 2OG-Fe(II) oxygenase [Streptomyces sp. NPDC090493]|uniref:putative 2OG-Fe(II) oxygenase n=1 Tax=Streptomyces sp. NPDC090493 TaxID=3365964 RepID=UPI00382FEE97